MASYNEIDGVPSHASRWLLHDVLRDEGVAYARRLDAAGVPVTHDHRPALCHGYLGLPHVVDRADDAMDALTDALGEHLG